LVGGSRPNPERQFRPRFRIRETQGQFLRQQNRSEREAGRYPTSAGAMSAIIS
jgi:hypothetical protein